MKSVRSALIVGAAVAALALAACDPVTNSDDAKVSDIQKYTQTVCKILPDAADIAKVLANGNPVIDTVSLVGDLLCKAFAAPKAGRGQGLPTVRGVPIHATRV